MEKGDVAEMFPLWKEGFRRISSFTLVYENFFEGKGPIIICFLPPYTVCIGIFRIKAEVFYLKIAKRVDKKPWEDVSGRPGMLYNSRVF